MTIRERHREQQVVQWAEMVRECRSSGQTVKGWCDERDISTKTYYRWEKRVSQRSGYGIKKEEGVPTEEKAAEFIEVTVEKEQTRSGKALQTAESGSWPVVTALVRGRGIEVEIYEGAEQRVIEAICRAVSHAE